MHQSHTSSLCSSQVLVYPNPDMVPMLLEWILLKGISEIECCYLNLGCQASLILVGTSQVEPSSNPSSFTSFY